MKLNEIFDVDSAQNLEQDNADQIGSGMFATVHQSKNDPHMVNRITTPSRDRNKLFQKEDGFEIYAFNIIDSKINESNPTFPRIYKRADGKYQIEKLVKLDSVGHEELLNYIENNFDINLDPGYSSHDLAFELTMLLANCFDMQDYSAVKNKYIIAACKWIENLARMSGTTLDIHGGNFMFRRTQHGLQLVITDPLY